MKKIISLFQRNYDGNHKVRNEIVPGAEWVIAGEGVATRKFDGTCCMVRDGCFFKRYEVKPGGKPPPNFEAANEVDVTGKQQGWLPIGDGPEDRWHREAFESHLEVDNISDGTYELCGPKIQGNPEGFDRHVLISHENAERLPDCPRDFDGIREFLKAGTIEGVVWHHEDGRMVKIKKKDFA